MRQVDVAEGEHRAPASAAGKTAPPRLELNTRGPKKSAERPITTGSSQSRCAARYAASRSARMRPLRLTARHGVCSVITAPPVGPYG